VEPVGAVPVAGRQRMWLPGSVRIPVPGITLSDTWGSPGGASCLIRWKACRSRSAASGRWSRPAARRSWPSRWRRRHGARPGRARATRPRGGVPSAGMRGA